MFTVVRQICPYMGGTPLFWEFVSIFLLSTSKELIMKNRFFGDPTPSPFDKGKGEKPSPPTPLPMGEGSWTSLAVRQWVEFARGARVHAPANDCNVQEVVGEARYCLGCVGVRGHDVVYAMRENVHFGVAICRCCGRESAA